MFLQGCHASSNLLKFEISPQISSNLLKKYRFSRKPPQISSNLLKKYRFSRKPPQISSKNVDFPESLLKSPQIQRIENSILAISLLNNTNNLRAVKHSCILGHHGNTSLYWLYVYMLKYFIIWSLFKCGIITRMRSIRVS